MSTRTSSAEWKGSLKEGSGNMRVGNGAWEGPFSFASRFESGAGTNPEELIGAAHAGCYSMFLSALLTKAGHPPTSVKTSATVHLGEGPTITLIELDTVGVVPGIDEAATAQALLLDLAPRVRRVGEAVDPTEAIPVVDMKGQRDHIAAPLQPRQPAIGRRAGVAAFGGVELDDEWHARPGLGLAALGGKGGGQHGAQQQGRQGQVHERLVAQAAQT